MHFIEQHKATIITSLLAGLVILGLFNFQLKRHGDLMLETYYLLEPEPESKDEDLEAPEDLNHASTNKAYNEDEAFKELMRNFKTVRPDDFERSTKAREATKAKEAVKAEQKANSPYKSYENSGDYALNSEETESYRKLQAELNERLKNKQQADEHAKTKGTLTYALKGRVLTHYKIPRYLCEVGGKIIITIKVNSAGNVVDASVNGASNSNNKCLIDHAISYAKSVQFNAASRQDQLGTITFLFQGK